MKGPDTGSTVCQGHGNRSNEIPRTWQLGQLKWRVRFLFSRSLTLSSLHRYAAALFDRNKKCVKVLDTPLIMEVLPNRRMSYIVSYWSKILNGFSICSYFVRTLIARCRNFMLVLHFRDRWRFGTFYPHVVAISANWRPLLDIGLPLFYFFYFRHYFV